MFYELGRERTTTTIHSINTFNFSYPSHMHNCFEIIIVHEGKTELKINNNMYILDKLNAILISPNTPHEFKPKITEECTDSNMEIIFVANTYIDEITKIFDKYSLNNPIYKLNDFEYKNIVMNLLDHINKNKNPLKLKGLSYLLFDLIISNTQLIEREYCINNDLTYKILRMVGQNYNKTLTLSSIAKSQNVCQTYVSRIFNNNLGISFNTYLSTLRVEKSCQLLKESDDSIVDIAIECGFDSQRSFNRSFKNITGQSPNEYRKLNTILKK